MEIDTIDTVRLVKIPGLCVEGVKAKIVANYN